MTTDGTWSAIGHPYDGLTGLLNTTDENGEDLIPTKDGLTGFRSPSTRWCLTDGQPGRLPVTSCRSRTEVTRTTR